MDAAQVQQSHANTQQSFHQLNQTHARVGRNVAAAALGAGGQQAFQVLDQLLGWGLEFAQMTAIGLFRSMGIGIGIGNEAMA